MNATLESLFGPPSDPVDIPAFIKTASQLQTEEAQLESSHVAQECSVSDLRDCLFDTWNNPTLSAYLSKDHDHTVTALYSTTKSAKPKRKVNLPDPESLPPDVIALQKNLDAVELTSFKLKPDSATFIRASKNSDHNVLAKVKLTTEPSAHLSGEAQAIITITVYNRSSWTSGYINRLSQHVLLSSQTLADLYQVIPCISKEISVVNPIPASGTSSLRTRIDEGCLICIENTVYGDGSIEENYAQKLSSHLQTITKDAPAITKATTTIQETPLSSLLLRINQPYWLLHKGSCEHFLVVDQIRLQHPADALSGYPLTLQISPPLIGLCRACTKVPASLSIIGDVRLGESPCLLCVCCWKHVGNPSDSNVIVKELPRYEIGW